MAARAAIAENQVMIESQNTFGERFNSLRGKMSYQALSDAIFTRFGVRITAQAMFLWVKKNGKITEENIKVIADFFNVREAWLRYGDGDKGCECELQGVIGALPQESQQQVFDFIQYKFERGGQLFAKQTLGDYLAMIDKIKHDLAAKRRKDEGGH